MEVFVEPIESNPRLVIFGAGHVAQPTAQMARLVGFDVTVIDARDELNTEERFAGCTRILAEPREAVADLPARETDWFLVVTHDHRADEEALDALLRRSHRYIGVIGSKRKVVRILARIQQRGTLPALDRVYAPVGLAVGAVSPAEIGVSIVSELVALRHGAPAPHLRFVDDPRVRKALAGEIAIESVDD